jgi:hypothetical protein
LKLDKDYGGKKDDNILYKKIVESLMYVTIDIIYSVNLISIYIKKPTKIHVLTIKRTLWYLESTICFGLFYKKGEKSNLMSFIYSDNIGD